MNDININLRQLQLQNLNKYVNDTDKDITLILQSLQWDRKHLQQGKQMLTCKYDSNHKIPAENVKEHEEKCYLKSQTYVTGDLLFPEPFDVDAITVVKLSSENINDIINYAVKTNPSFKRSSESGVSGHAPLTLGRLQATYSTDERRALYDAVAAAAPPPAALDQQHRDPAVHEAAATSWGAESRDDALLALRDARRRRARHRRAARDGYKHELRELITTQMELFTGKLTDENADIKLDVTNDDIDDVRRCDGESDRQNHGRGYGRTKYINTNSRESREDKTREYKRESRDHNRRGYERERREHKRGERERDSKGDRESRDHKEIEYERESRENKRETKERENRGDKRKEYERERKENKRRECEREGREEKRKKYDNEYDIKCKERNKIYERDVRKHQQPYDREYLEIKQEKDDYPADRRKREERSYDYKNRKEGRNRPSFRDNKQYHRREERHHKQVG